MNWAYNKGDMSKIHKIVSDFEDHAENVYSDKVTHTYNKELHERYSTIITFQFNRNIFDICRVLENNE